MAELHGVGCHGGKQMVADRGRTQLAVARKPCTGNLLPHKHESHEPFHSAFITERSGPVSATCHG